MKILLAVDGSECSMAVMDEAARLPWPAESSLKVLSVAEIPILAVADPLMVSGDSYAEWERTLEEQAVANTAKALERYYEAKGPPIEISAKNVKGDPKIAIVDEAELWGANLVMIGTHGYNALERFWLGSVSRAVASNARCSVEVVRGREGQRDRAGSAMKILLAVDGSECSEAAVKEVAGRPWPVGSEVSVVSAIHLPFTPNSETWSLPESYYAQVEKASREQADLAIERAISLLRESNSGRGIPLTLTRSPIVGRAEDVIINAAKEWGADLIMVGSHGYRGWRRFVLGSVAQAVAWHTLSSVQIVRARLSDKERKGL